MSWKEGRTEGTISLDERQVKEIEKPKEVLLYGEKKTMLIGSFFIVFLLYTVRNKKVVLLYGEKKTMLIGSFLLFFYCIRLETKR